MESKLQKVVISVDDSDDEVVILLDDSKVVISLDDSDDEVQICEPFESKKRKLNEAAVYKTRRQREYEMLADLTDYPDLAAMFAAEKIWRRNRKKKNKKKRKKNRKTEYEAQNEKVNEAGKEEERPGNAQNLFADATEEENQAHSYEAVKTIAFKACDYARSADVTVLSSLSLEKDEVTTNLGSSDGLREMMSIEAIVSEELTRIKAQESEADATEEENQAHSYEAVKTIAFKSCDYARSAEVTDLSSLSLEKDEITTNLGNSDGLGEILPTKAIVSEELTRIKAQESDADATEEENQPHFYEAVKTIAFKACDDARSAEVTDLSSLSLEKDEVTTNLGSSDGLKEMVPTKVIVSKESTTIKAQESDVDATEEENQPHFYEAVKTMAFKACDDARTAEVTDLSSLSLEKDEVTTNLGSSNGLKEMVPTKADATEEENQPHFYEAVKTIAFKACDDARSAEVTDLSSLSLEKDEVTTNLGSSDGLKEMVPTKVIVSEASATIKAQESDVEIADEEKQVDSSKDEETKISLETKSVETSGNIVLRKLLRGPRYFDHPKSSRRMCFSCGADDHIAVNCIVKKQKKPCFICGGLEHIAKHCKQRNACSICGGRGHLNKDCTEKHPTNSGSSKFCLRCGDSGHDLFLCNNDYSPEDLKIIQCYVCKAFGHLCCAEFVNEGPRQVSCYSCGQSGHLGSGCPKLHTDSGGSPSTFRCYRCREEGHIARNCMKIATAKPGRIDLANPERFPEEKKSTTGFAEDLKGCPKLHTDSGGSPSTFRCYKCREEGHIAQNCMKIATAKPGTVDLANPERFPEEKKSTTGFAEDLKAKPGTVDLANPERFPEEKKSTTGFAEDLKGCPKLHTDSSGSPCPKLHTDSGGSPSTFRCYKCREEGHIARNCMKIATAKPGTVDLANPERFLEEKKSTTGFGHSTHELASHKMQYNKGVNMSEDQSRWMCRWNTVQPPNQFLQPPNQFNGEARVQPPNQFLQPPNQFLRPPNQFNGEARVQPPNQFLQPPNQFHGEARVQPPNQFLRPPNQFHGEARVQPPNQFLQPPYQFNGGARPNVWLSPALSARMSQETPAFPGFHQFSTPQYPQQNFNHYAGSQCSQAYQPFSASRHDG